MKNSRIISTEVNMETPTRLDYCQYLESSQINSTLTHKASHSERFSHDLINRSLAGDRITPHRVWDSEAQGLPLHHSQ